MTETKIENLFLNIFDLHNGYILKDNILFLKENNLTEKFNKNKLLYLIENQNEIEQICRKDARNLIDLDKFYKQSKNGILPVHYNQKDNGLYGRYFVKNAIGGANLMREYRHVIFSDYYNDIDIDNCHPNIISWLCKNMGIDCKYLNEYINNRNEIINELIELNPNLSFSWFKMSFISIMYGCEDKTFDNNFPYKNDFIIKFRNEFLNNAKSICDKLYKFKELNNKSYNLYGSTLCHIATFVENQLLMLLIEFFKDKQFDLTDAILCFDGIMINKRNKLTLGTLLEVDNYFKSMGININVSIKQMDMANNLLMLCDYDHTHKYGFQDEEIKFIPKPEVEEIEIKNYFDFKNDYYWSDFKNDLSKIVFENELEGCLYLQHNLHKVCAFVNNNVILKKDSDDSYEVLGLKNWGIVKIHYLKKSGNTEIEIIKSIRDFTSFNMRYFNIFNKTSSNFSYPRNLKEFDLSKPFIAKIIEMNDKSKGLVNDFKNLIKMLFCGDDDNVFNYLWKWLAFTVKYPHLKTKVGLLLISKQGCGKGFFTDFLSNYIYGKYNCIPNMNGMDQLIGDKNLHLLGKKLVCVNELSSNKDTYSSNSNKIKSIITEEDIMIRPLYSNAFNAKQTCELILSSNHLSSIIMEDTDRRWFVLSINEKYRNNKNFFGDLHDKFYNQNSGDCVFTDLMNQDFTISDFWKLNIPITNKKLEIKEISKSSPFLFIDEIRNDIIEDLIISKIIPEDYTFDDIIKPSNRKNYIKYFKFNVIELFENYNKWCNDNNEKSYRRTVFRCYILDYGVEYNRVHGTWYILI